jgi:hypothetical protein
MGLWMWVAAMLRCNVEWKEARHTRGRRARNTPERQILTHRLARDFPSSLEDTRNDRRVGVGRPVLDDVCAEETRNSLERDVVLVRQRVSSASPLPRKHRSRFLRARGARVPKTGKGRNQSRPSQLQPIPASPSLHTSKPPSQSKSIQANPIQANPIRPKLHSSIDSPSDTPSSHPRPHPWPCPRRPSH